MAPVQTQATLCKARDCKDIAICPKLKYEKIDWELGFELIMLQIELLKPKLVSGLRPTLRAR